MAIITRAYSEVQGQIAQASSVNRVLDDLYTLQGGNIDSSNIGRSAINSSNYALSSVHAGALQSSAVNVLNLAGSAAIDLILRNEVFG